MNRQDIKFGFTRVIVRIRRFPKLVIIAFDNRWIKEMN